ncbi:MAG TPA: SAM-dependent chlorinase/fluorinase [Candidatus Sulfotelmatobacter sp.]|nr:SAM-dependent chlorinase/fluorinase [Candidatus Sulfotelmatobacter sp.]
MPSRPTVTLTTDFGTNDHFVGAMKGVILDIVPEAQIVDISHAVQPFDVLDGALTISQAYSYFPSATVHLVVVDPGVGTARRPIIASSDKYHFVAPDNGVLSLIYAQEERMSVRHISSDHYFLQPVSNTFHARDIFSPVAAYLAKQVDSHKFGDEIEDYARFAAPKPKAAGENRMRAVVLKVDRFGNLITNITPKDAPMLFGADPVPFKLVVGNKEITVIRQLYAEGAAGEVFAIMGSMGFLEIAANRGAAAQITGAGKGSEVSIILSEGAAAGKGA